MHVFMFAGMGMHVYINMVCSGVLLFYNKNCGLLSFKIVAKCLNEQKIITFSKFSLEKNTRTTYKVSLPKE